MTDYQTLIVEQDGPVALIRLNRPEALNALSNRLMDELGDALSGLEADDEVRCIVLTGSEKAFAAGADIKEMADKPAADFYKEDFFAGWTSPFEWNPS